MDGLKEERMYLKISINREMGKSFGYSLDRIGIGLWDKVWQLTYPVSFEIKSEARNLLWNL